MMKSPPKNCRRLPREFYARPVLIVAKELLGKLLVRNTSYGRIVARIVEVEAYGGSDDPASHAFKGITERNKVMFGEPGHVYVYFTYGMHFCLNVKAESEGVPRAVLIRAVEIVDGVELALKNRKLSSITGLSNGPGKLTKALNITKAQNGLDLVQSDQLNIRELKETRSVKISTSTRIGIKTGRDKLWRFFIKNTIVSRPS
jgi:DNA-3-methyladenine glycosylase